MLLGKVVGTVVATRKDPRLVSSKMLVVRPMDPRGKAEGNYLVAVDTVDAGVGETVLVVSGSSAALGSGLEGLPVAARAASASGCWSGSRSRPGASPRGARWWRSTRSARASAKKCSSCAAKRRAFR